MIGLAHRHSTESLDNGMASGEIRGVVFVSRDIFEKRERVKDGIEFKLDESLEDGAWRVE